MGSEEQSFLDEVSAQQSLLDKDSIPNANQSLTCFSCDQPMTGLYCYACGNKNDNYRRSVWSLGVELFQSLTAFEGRIWRSLYSLIFRPGQMAREFADGARQRWTSPIRLFLATSLLLFGYIAFSGTQIIALGDLQTGEDVRSSQNGFHFGADDERFNQRLLFFVRQDQLKTPPLDQLESARRGFNFNFGENETPESLQEAIDELDKLIAEAGTDIERNALQSTQNGLQQSLSKMQNDAANEISDDGQTQGVTSTEGGGGVTFSGLNGESFTLDNDGISELYVRVLQNPSIVNNHLNAKLKWAMFFMMPFAMFMGAIFIRGRETAMLYDHLVHAAYVHSFSFLLLFIFIIVAQFTPLSGLIIWYTLILLIYLPISAKRAFRRGWFKSVLTAYGVGSVYTLIMMLTAIFIVVIALQDIAKDITDAQTARSVIEAPR